MLTRAQTIERDALRHLAQWEASLVDLDNARNAELMAMEYDHVMDAFNESRDLGE